MSGWGSDRKCTRTRYKPRPARLAARYGRKSLYVSSILGFTIKSMLCGAAQSLEQIVVFRVLQGAFGAALAPLSQATLLDIYPPERRGFAMAILGMGIMLGPIMGPTLGGWLTETYNWRWVFYINLPFGLLAAAGLMIFLPSSDRQPRLRFDWLGFGMLAITIGAMQLMLDRGQGQDWFTSREIIVEAVFDVGGQHPADFIEARGETALHEGQRHVGNGLVKQLQHRGTDRARSDHPAMAHHLLDGFSGHFCNIVVVWCAGRKDADD